MLRPGQKGAGRLHIIVLRGWRVVYLPLDLSPDLTVSHSQAFSEEALEISHPCPAPSLAQLENEVRQLIIFPAQDGRGSEPICQLTTATEIIGAAGLAFRFLWWLVLVVDGYERAACAHQAGLKDVAQEMAAIFLLRYIPCCEPQERINDQKISPVLLHQILNEQAKGITCLDGFPVYADILGQGIQVRSAE